DSSRRLAYHGEQSLAAVDPDGLECLCLVGFVVCINSPFKPPPSPNHVFVDWFPELLSASLGEHRCDSEMIRERHVDALKVVLQIKVGWLGNHPPTGRRGAHVV